MFQQKNEKQTHFGLGIRQCILPPALTSAEASTENRKREKIKSFN